MGTRKCRHLPSDGACVFHVVRWPICFSDTSLAIRILKTRIAMHCDDGGSHMRKSFVALLLLVGAARPWRLRRLPTRMS